MIRFFYNLLIHAIGAPILCAYYAPKIVFNGKYRKSLSGKLGWLPETFPKSALKAPVVWFHAVSVGETVALGPVVRQFRKLAPESFLIVSTGTETGQEMAKTSITQADAFIYMPIDSPLCLNPVIERIKPDLFVLMETEIWPNMLYGLKRSGAVISLANGRISDRSFPRYMKIQPLVSRMLEKIDSFLMVSEVDRNKIVKMGAKSDRVVVVGNTKFDAALKDVSDSVLIEAQNVLDLSPDHKVFMAGSTHPGEHELVLDCFKSLLNNFPDLILIIAPRHIETVPAILSAIEERKLASPFLRSSGDSGIQRGSRNIIILDTTGELFKFYSVADVVFIGGSLVQKGGQNILEPAAWGKRLFFGPSMEDFRDARDLLVSVGAATEVRDLQDLSYAVCEALRDLEGSKRLGDRGRQELTKHAGSASITAKLLFDLIITQRKD
jgi:3-deoxy-D-manno-octulosonic-acid transferase